MGCLPVANPAAGVAFLSPRLGRRNPKKMARGDGVL